MKDARGHGSNSRDMMLDINGKGIMPSRPFREGTAHQVSIAEDHGIATDHLMHHDAIGNWKASIRDSRERFASQFRSKS